MSIRKIFLLRLRLQALSHTFLRAIDPGRELSFVSRSKLKCPRMLLAPNITVGFPRNESSTYLLAYVKEAGRVLYILRQNGQ